MAHETRRTPAPRTAPSEGAAAEHDLVMHRSSPEAAPMITGRASGWSARGRTATGVAMLAVGLAMALGSLLALGSRVFPAFRAARDTGADPAATFFWGTDGSALDLALVIGLIVLVPLGVVLGWLGYRRLTDDGPSLAGVHVSNAPNSVISQLGAGHG